MNGKLLAVVALVALISCGGGDEAAVSSATSESDSAAPAGVADNPAPTLRRLVKRAELEIRVPDTRAAMTRLEALTMQSGGYVASVSAERHNDMLHYSLTLRVPVQQLDAALSAIRALATQIDQDSVATEDVTEQYVDLEARLRTLRATEAELLELLGAARESGRKLEDVIAVHDKLTEIRTTIEQIDAQRKTLQQLSALSTIQVELRPSEAGRPMVAEGWRPGEALRRSARMLVAALQGLANLAIWLVVFALPVGVVVAVPVWAVARALRAARRRRSSATREEVPAG